MEGHFIRRFLIVLAVVAVLSTESCGPNGELALNTVTDSEYENVSKVRSGQYTLMNNQELTTLKHDAEIGKGVGRYQINKEGFRTWRLDTATGQICLLLTAEADWKKPEIQAQGCNQ